MKPNDEMSGEEPDLAGIFLAKFVPESFIVSAVCRREIGEEIILTLPDKDDMVLVEAEIEEVKK